MIFHLFNLNGEGWGFEKPTSTLLKRLLTLPFCKCLTTVPASEAFLCNIICHAKGNEKFPDKIMDLTKQVNHSVNNTTPINFKKKSGFMGVNKLNKKKSNKIKMLSDVLLKSR